MSTIFHKFATGELRPDTVRYEDDQMLAFDDIHPKAPVHVLIIPKKEIVSIAEMSEEDAHLVASLIWRAKLLAEELGIAEGGYKIGFNVGAGGGQEIPYLHLHLTGAK